MADGNETTLPTHGYSLPPLVVERPFPGDFVDRIIAQPQAPRRLAELVAKMRGKMSVSDALTLSAYARAAAPEDGLVWALTEDIVRPHFHVWHWSIARMEGRNRLYDRAIRENIGPDSVVLEIGTGSGILAMMAARAGARHVYTIEILPAMAEAARRNIAANGFADRITVINKDANDALLGEDIAERCNVFLHEIVDNTLLREALLPLTKLARERFLTQDAVLLPERVWICGQLTGQERTLGLRRPHTQWDGFDLSAFDVFEPHHSTIKSSARTEMALTNPARLLEFDLCEDFALENAGQLVPMELTATGTPKGLIQWIGFGFPGGLEYELDEKEPHAWSHILHPLGEQEARSAGDIAQLEVTYNRSEVGFRLLAQ